MITRRRFLKATALAGTGMLILPALPGFSDLVGMSPVAQAYNTSPKLSKFTQPLRGVGGPGGIPVAIPDGTKGINKAAHYTIDINQYQDYLHPDLGPTTLWGYNPRNALGVTGQPTPKHLGGIIVANRGEPVQITFQNNLPKNHILPVDATLGDATVGGVNRTAVHLHGGQVPWISDGGPFSWFSPNGGYGKSAKLADGSTIYNVLNPNLQKGQAEYFYPNNQSARFMWYHDHAMDITRLNAYAGLATGYILRDEFEKNLVINQGLPDYIENGGREIPLIIQEKIFIGSDLKTQDPTWPKTCPSTPGSLWYAHVYDTSLWDQGTPQPQLTLPDPSCVPEFFGDRMLVNGTVYPKTQVEPRRYRLRVLNATQARFLNLQLYVADSSGTLPEFTQKGPDFLVIGTEGGFLSRPALVNSGKRLNTTSELSGDRTVDPSKPGGSLLTAPAERWDIIIDFTGYAGKKLILYNDAPAPFPGGAAGNDGPTEPATTPNEVVYTNQTMLRFDVAKSITGKADPPLSITTSTSLTGGIDPSFMPWSAGPQDATKMYPTAKVRQLTLNEVFDGYGRLIQMLGTNKPTDLAPLGYTLPPETTGAPQTYVQPYEAMPTEVTNNGDVEIWQIANLTGDTHPMHFHLVNVQVLSRQPFAGYMLDQNGNGTPVGLGVARGPDNTELGWKETVRMNPNEVTTIMMRFTLPAVPFVVPPSPRTGGNEYVWHCHILEHEEHDMMRPLVVN